MNKKTNWIVLLHEQINIFQHKPFAWGSHDCCTFAADCILAMTGTDVMAGQRTYKSQAGANRKMKVAGGMAPLIDGLLDTPIDPAFAQRGDVVCFRSPLGDAAGICMGVTIAAPGPLGVFYSPMAQAYQAWRV